MRQTGRLILELHIQLLISDMVEPDICRISHRKAINIHRVGALLKRTFPILFAFTMLSAKWLMLWFGSKHRIMMLLRSKITCQEE